LEVLEVEDIVDHLNVGAGIRRGEMRQLGERSRRRLAAIGHRRAVEAAERAVHPFAPPAAARGFDEDARLPVRTEAAALELIEEVAVIGIRERVEVRDRWRVRRLSRHERATEATARQDTRQI